MPRHYHERALFNKKSRYLAIAAFLFSGIPENSIVIMNNETKFNNYGISLTHLTCRGYPVMG